jgi:Mor family transcriptional regulator
LNFTHHLDPQLTPAQADDAAVQLEHDFVRIVREEIGMHEAMASLVAQALVRGLRRTLGGQHLYIPAPDKRARDEAIRREFNGSNIAEVMKRYNVRRSRVYEICASQPLRQGIGVSAAKSPVSTLETGQAE